MIRILAVGILLTDLADENCLNGQGFFPSHHLSNEKKTDSLEYIGDYTIQLYGDYNN